MRLASAGRARTPAKKNVTPMAMLNPTEKNPEGPIPATMEGGSYEVTKRSRGLAVALTRPME